MALFGSGVAELTRHRAEQLARDLVERSKQNRDELMRMIRSEIQNQIASLGVSSKRDVERLERRVARLEVQLKEAKQKATAPKPAPKKTTAKRTTTKRSTKDAGGSN
jgi:phage shock protein A